MKSGFKLIVMSALFACAQSVVAQQVSYYEKGSASMYEGEVREAQNWYEQALEVNPFDPTALNNLAVVRTEQGNYHTALELLERANKLAPNNRDIQFNYNRLRGWLLSYADGDVPPAARMGVPKERLQGGLPPEPPPLWKSASMMQRTTQPALREPVIYR